MTNVFLPSALMSSIHRLIERRWYVTPRRASVKISSSAPATMSSTDVACVFGSTGSCPNPECDQYWPGVSELFGLETIERPALLLQYGGTRTSHVPGRPTLPVAGSTETAGGDDLSNPPPLKLASPIESGMFSE